MTLNSGSFDTGGFAQSFSSFDFQGGTLTQGGATLTLTNSLAPLTMTGGTTISGASYAFRK